MLKALLLLLGWFVGLTVTQTVPPQCVRNDQCDFMLVLDGSSSIAAADWGVLVDFARDLTNSLAVQYPNFRTGVVTFSDTVALQQGLTASLGTLNATYANLRANQPGGTTRTDLGIQTALTELTTTGANRDCFFMFVVTDGVSSQTQQTLDAANAAKNAVGKTTRRIVAIGIGDNVDANELASIASEPTSANVQIVNAFTDLSGILQQLCFITTGTGCGDGTITAGNGEQCDDNNLVGGDGCSFTCQIEAGCSCSGAPSVCTCAPVQTCGDGTVISTEGCDDGNINPNDGCSATCIVEVGFACSTNPLGRSICVRQSCIDTALCDIAIVLDKSGSIDDSEWALVQAFGVSLVNNLAVIFPNGRQAIITYDSAAELNQPLTPDLNTLITVVNGLPNGGGNTQTDDAIRLANQHLTQNARSTCRFMYILTDGVSTQRQNTIDDATAAKAAGITILAAGVGDQVDPDEINTIASAINLATTAASFNDLQQLAQNVCQFFDVNTCGDAVRRGTEACDDGNTINGDGCTGCAVDTCFTCVEATQFAPSVCTRQTGVPGCNQCGNLNRESTETCDDGNTVGGDGCSAACQEEIGWRCTLQPAGIPDVCLPICSDGLLRGTEPCDDGNLIAGDGCSILCVVEPLFICTNPNGINAPSVCVGANQCSNGITIAPETCDDGNITPGDGCSTGCLIEIGWTCNTTPQPSVCTPICGDGRLRGGQACDDSNTIAGDGCNTGCSIEPGCTCSNPNGIDSPSVCTCSCSNSFVCGNGNREPGELCDDGNAVDSDGCTNCILDVGFACTVSVPNVCTPTCGNAIITGAELCDDGALVPSDGCNAACSTEVGYLCSATGCTAQFTCGNGNIQPGEVCDDNNFLSDDGCSSTCGVELGFNCPSIAGALAGTIVSQCALTCVEGLCKNGGTCSIDLLTSNFVCRCVNGWSGRLCDNCDTRTCGCGDLATIVGTEQCDDGNNRNGDGCSANCLLETARFSCSQIIVATNNITVCSTIDVCGDALKGPTEVCDDGNLRNGDGCSVNCAVENTHTCTTDALQTSGCVAVCGDGIRFPEEACDDGNTVSGDGCSATCQGEANFLCQNCGTRTSVCSACIGVACGVCGDAITVPGLEECDDGNTRPGDGASASCVPEVGWVCTVNPFGRCACTRCGDGIRQVGEQCDDGDLLPGDGCASNCQVEQGWKCIGSVGELSRCEAVCGDGLVVLPELCDDGNLNPGDGCGPFCTPELSFFCTNGNTIPNSVCVARNLICGNGRVEEPEACDDNNVVLGDGCTAGCNVEVGWSCTRVLGQLSVCTRITTCGNGIRDVGEECDDGNILPGDGCSTTCNLECGNGIIDENELCEVGILNGLDCDDVNDDFDGGVLACNNDCTLDITGCNLELPDVPDIFGCRSIDDLDDRHQCITFSPHNPAIPICLNACGLECTNCKDHSWPWWVWVIAFIVVLLLALLALVLELILNRFKPPKWGPVPTFDERMQARRLEGLPGPGATPAPGGYGPTY